MSTDSTNRSSAAFSQGDLVRVVGVADFNDQEGEVAWVEGDRLGVWLDDDEPRMPVTFLATEVRRV